MAWYDWKPYVPVATRRRRAKKKMDSLRKRGVDVQPVEIEGRKIARTFWGKAWCDHLESFSDYANRLPRGRSYVRNGSVCHLAVAKGKVEAKVAGSEMYNIRIRIKTLAARKWDGVKQRCAGRIGSLIELLQGNLSDGVMEVVTDRKNGLFPLPGEISLDCDCPDWAVMCKHVAAVLYGVGARLDRKPELLFTLRGVNHDELIDTDAEVAVSAATKGGKSKRLAAGDLSDVFGIDIDAGSPEESPRATPGKKAKKTIAKRKAVKKKATRKKAVRKDVTEKKAVKSKTGAKKAIKRTDKKETSIKASKKTVKKKTRRVKNKLRPA